MKRVSIFYIFIFTFVINLSIVYAQQEGHFTRGSIAYEYGNWKPSDLDDNSSKLFTTISGTDYYQGVSITSPTFRNYALRLAYIYWKQDDLSNVQLEYVSLRHISAELKNYILAQSRICPYVNYGIATIWSREVPSGGNNDRIKLDQAGYGFNVGAGLDIYLFSHLGVTAEYSYLYAKFPEKVGLTDNYSGPKICMRLNYLF